MSPKGRKLLVLAIAGLAPTIAMGALPVPTVTLPSWVAKLITSQPPKSALVIEEALYRGRRVFQILPPDRAPDSGNEHVLHSEDGRIICEFGGVAGHVTVGSCEIERIKFVRTVLSSHVR